MDFTKSELEMLYQYAAPTKEETLAGLKEIVPVLEKKDDLLSKVIVDRSPAKKSRNNLSLIRKYAYNILRLAMLETGMTNIMTEMMDCFCDNAALREQYVLTVNKEYL